jgi:hypothetical protein
MSRKMLKVLILGAMVVSALVSASQASAATWNSNGSGRPGSGGTAFNGTAPASKLTLSGVAAGINCTTTTNSGLLYGPTGTVGTDRVADVSLAFSTCRAGGFTATVSCTALDTSLWANSYAAPVITGVVNANGSSVCTVTVPSISGCRIDVAPAGGIGSALASGTYNNTTGQLTVNATGQAITSTWSSCGTLFGSASGSAASTFTNASGGALVFTVTSTFRPSVTI